MNFEKIDNSIYILSDLIQNSDEEAKKKLIAEYIFVFDQLFADGLEQNSIQSQISSLLEKNTPDADEQARLLNYEYIKRIVILKNQIDTLPENHPYKSQLNNRILDNCSSEWIDKFNQGTFTNTKKDFVAFRKSQETVDWNNTVEVKTWGTKEELGNGLKNVLRQKIKGEAIGHAALVMRLPVSAPNRALIDKYCHHEDGSLKIPYEVKKYGNQSVYEVYWSYWPGRLNNLRDDIKEELTGFEFKAKSNVINQLPQEVKERYLLQKQRKDLFQNRQVIDLAPVATKVIKNHQHDYHRDMYLILKTNKYKLKEEIDSLKTFQSNYLELGNEFDHTDKDWTQKNIKSTSNFLTFLSRFKHEFPESSTYSRILRDKKINQKDAEKLYEDLKLLIENKESQAKSVNEQLIDASKGINTSYVEIKNLKKRIKEIQKNLGGLKYFSDKEKEIQQLINTNPPYKPPNGLMHFLDSINLDKLKRDELVDSETLTKKQLQVILTAAKNFSEKLPAQSKFQDDLKKAKADLDALYMNPKAKMLESFQKNLTEKIDELSERQMSLIEFENSLSTEEEKQDAEYLVSIQKDKIKEINDEISSINEKINMIKLESHTSIEELKEQNIIRGTPISSVILKNFNIEEMLKKASELSSTTSAFDVVQENCSTTCMKLLHSGSPAETKHMFKWSKNTIDKPETQIFLTNPQTIYSASTIVNQDQNGDKNARKMIKKEQLKVPHTEYYMKLNKLMAFHNDYPAMLNEIKQNIIDYLNIVPNLLADLWVKGTNKVNKNETEIDKFMLTLNKEIKAQDYSIIAHQNPLYAIDVMKEKLQTSPNALPFFDEKTLKSVRDYVLELESKEPKSDANEQHITDYYQIIKERDERVACIEQAISMGKDPSKHLTNRTGNSDSLKWGNTPAHQTEILVNRFFEEYTKLRNQEIGSFARSNFVATIKKDVSLEDKLKTICQHIMERPNSRSAAAWKNCRVQEDVLRSLNLKSPLKENNTSDKKTPFKTMKIDYQKLQKVKEQDTNQSNLGNRK